MGYLNSPPRHNLGGQQLSILNTDKILGPKSWNYNFICQEIPIIIRFKKNYYYVNVSKTNKLYKHKSDTKEKCPTSIYLFKQGAKHVQRQ